VVIFKTQMKLTRTSKTIPHTVESYDL